MLRGGQTFRCAAIGKLFHLFKMKKNSNRLDFQDGFCSLYWAALFCYRNEIPRCQWLSWSSTCSHCRGSRTTTC
jgi:hypothetical protein